MANPVEIFFVIAIIIIILSCIGMCIRPKALPPAVQHCSGCRCHEQSQGEVQLQWTPVVVTVPAGSQPPYAYAPPPVDSLSDKNQHGPATTTSFVNNAGIRLEVAPPAATVIDMYSSSSAVPPAADFSTHPKPTVVTTMHGESESDGRN
ncbi:hypothetical protein BGZ95_009762 [Linnemannia exigua]|uniref:Uncharacterized protein n=1 Tax=Linnemannia exigua TaxID=604196 RepID=A0AAD4HBT0_9FUNG|nr:hypothetical protein BGZ95_009762 [Linnemannia exigua]